MCAEDKFRLLLICALLLLFFLVHNGITTVGEAKGAHVWADAQGRSVKAPAGLIEQIARDDDGINNCLRENRGAAEVAKLVDVEQRDLNGDGRPEFLILFKDVCRGAFAAGPVFVYRRSAQGYTQLLSDFGVLTVRKSMTNGYFDLQVGGIAPESPGSAAERGLVIYKFKQGRYRVSECLTEIYAGKRRGREIYRYKRHKC
jgi:hypothetical protein